MGKCEKCRSEADMRDGMRGKGAHAQIQWVGTRREPSPCDIGECGRPEVARVAVWQSERAEEWRPPDKAWGAGGSEAGEGQAKVSRALFRGEQARWSQGVGADREIARSTLAFCSRRGRARTLTEPSLPHP